jgi:hypothetical protein
MPGGFARLRKQEPVGSSIDLHYSVAHDGEAVVEASVESQWR